MMSMNQEIKEFIQKDQETKEKKLNKQQEQIAQINSNVLKELRKTSTVEEESELIE